VQRIISSRKTKRRQIYSWIVSVGLKDDTDRGMVSGLGTTTFNYDLRCSFNNYMEFQLIVDDINFFINRLVYHHFSLKIKSANHID
jgi:hypothetical protein